MDRRDFVKKGTAAAAAAAMLRTISDTPGQRKTIAELIRLPDGSVELILFFDDGEEMSMGQWEHFDIIGEKGLVFEDTEKGKVMHSNGHWRREIRLWKGFERWEDYETGSDR